MPAGFKRLSGSVAELLEEFKEISGGNVEYSFQRPGAGLDEDAKNAYFDSLSGLGIRPYNIQAQTKEGSGNEQRLLFPEP
jgi:hypothetical protein